ncbi:25333_t:CDS:1, partial [Gigaspora rosea]
KSRVQVFLVFLILVLVLIAQTNARKFKSRPIKQIKPIPKTTAPTKQDPITTTK